MAQMNFAQALNDALRLEMERDPKMYVAGEDVGVFGGVFGVTAGLVEKFGERRVRDTPITESAIVGTAVVRNGTGIWGPGALVAVGAWGTLAGFDDRAGGDTG